MTLDFNIHFKKFNHFKGNLFTGINFVCEDKDKTQTRVNHKSTLQQKNLFYIDFDSEKLIFQK